MGRPPLQWGYIFLGWGQKLGKMGSFRSDKFAATYSLSVFWKFINKNAIKSGFEGGIGRNISKTSKKCPFFQSYRDISTKTHQKIHLPRCRDPSPQKYPCLTGVNKAGSISDTRLQSNEDYNRTFESEYCYEF